MERTFGDYISSGRNVRGITLRELAKELELDISTLAKIEKNWKQFPKNKLQKLANVFHKNLDEVLIEFLRTDLYSFYSEFPNFKDLIRSAIDDLEPKISIEDIIDEGENKKVEFKSTLRLCLKSLKAEKHIEHSSIKNICAFLNSEGGKLIIGVADDKTILGLEDYDFKTFNETDKKDAWLKHFDNLISKYLSNSLSKQLFTTFIKVNNKTIVCIDVLPNNVEPTFLKNPEKNNIEEFYVRRNASAITLNMPEFFKYSKERW